MRNILVIALLILGSSSAYAKKNCTDQSKDKWMSIKDFKEMTIKKGYTIRKFKQPGSCYEIYGKNKDGREVEVYFNPVDGSVIKVEFED